MAAANTTAAKQTAEKLAEETKKLSDDATKRFDENSQRIKEFNSTMAESSKAANRMALDHYETAVKNFFNVQRQLAGASQTDWVKNTADTQIQFGEQVTHAWITAARNLVK